MKPFCCPGTQPETLLSYEGIPAAPFRHPGAAREVSECLFWVFGGFLAALGAPRDVPERPGEAKSDQKEP